MSKKLATQKPSTINIALVGMHGCGKTAILVKFYTDRYIVEYSASIVDSVQKTEIVDGQSFLLNIRDNKDTDENYCQSTFNWADILLVVYSITSRSSYYRAMEIFRLYSQFNKQKKSIAVLVANKSDLADLRLVQSSESRQTADAFGSTYIECNVVIDNEPVKHLFHQSIKLYAQHVSTNRAPCPTFPDQLQNLSKLILPTKPITNSSPTAPKIPSKSSDNKSNDSVQKKNSVAFRLFSSKKSK